jgi:transposase
MTRPSRYPEEFRRQAAALVLDSGRSVRDVGREIGVNHETLRNWVGALRKERQGDPRAGQANGQASGQTSGEQAEVTRLRRRVAELELEKEILKKAAVFFARETER